MLRSLLIVLTLAVSVYYTIWMWKKYKRSLSFTLGFGSLFVATIGLVGGLAQYPGGKSSLGFTAAIIGLTISIIVLYIENKFLEKLRHLEFEKEKVLIRFKNLVEKLGTLTSESTRPLTPKELNRVRNHKIQSVVFGFIFSAGAMAIAYYTYDSTDLMYTIIIVGLSLIILFMFVAYAFMYRKIEMEGIKYILKGVITDKSFFDTEDSTDYFLGVSEVKTLVADSGIYKKINYGDIVELTSNSPSYLPVEEWKILTNIMNISDEAIKENFAIR